MAYNYAINFDSIVDDAEKSTGMQPIALNRGAYVEDAISTGSLSFDLITGGGWAPGRWITLFGLEGAGKSSMCYFSLRDSILHNVPALFKDHEGSTEANYLERILQMPLSNIQGLKNEKGEWIKRPKIRYYPADLGETTFRFLHRILKALPDKIMVDKQWYLVYDKDFKGEFDDSDYDKRLYKNTGKIYVPCESGSAQLLSFIDSLPAMLPAKRDENDEASAMAQQARMFAENLPLVKPMLRRKRATVVATNQIRLRPAMMFGNPEYEPCGEAVKFYSDCRVRLSTMANPRAKGQIEEEDGIDGKGTDRYRYIKLRTIKNKMFSPFRETILRVWFEESGEPGRGIDPVWDTYQFLTETGQIESGRKGYNVRLPGPWKGAQLTWPEFKFLILCNDPIAIYKRFSFFKNDKVDTLLKKKKRRERRGKGTASVVSKIYAKLLDYVDFRQACRNQLEDSTAFRKYFDVLGLVETKKEKKKGSLDLD